MQQHFFNNTTCDLFTLTFSYCKTLAPATAHYSEVFFAYPYLSFSVASIWLYLAAAADFKILIFFISIFQAALLNSFPAIFDELLQMFTVQEVAEFVRGTLGSMPSTVHIGQSMDVVKLQSIARTVDSRLFSFSGKTVVSQVKSCPCLRAGTQYITIHCWIPVILIIVYLGGIIVTYSPRVLCKFPYGKKCL